MNEFSSSSLIVLILAALISQSFCGTAIVSPDGEYFMMTENAVPFVRNKNNACSAIIDEHTKTQRFVSENVASGVQQYFNITLSNFSRMVIRDTVLTVNGTLSITDYGALFIINSTVLITPQYIDENVPVISLENYALLRIINSNVTISPPSSMIKMLAPYIITDDEASVAVVSSSLTTNMPAMNRSSHIGGGVVAAGKSKWLFKSSTVHVRTNVSGCWFWFSLSGGELVVCDNSSISIDSRFVDIFAHGRGKMRVSNSCITGLTIFEGSSVGELIASTLSPMLGVVDNAMCTLSNSSVNGNVRLTDNASALMINTRISGTVKCAGNSTLTLQKSKINGPGILFQRATMIAENMSDFGLQVIGYPWLGIYSDCTLILRNATISNITVDEKNNASIIASHTVINKIFGGPETSIRGDMTSCTLAAFLLGMSSRLNITLRNHSTIASISSNKGCVLYFTLLDGSTISTLLRADDWIYITLIDAPMPALVLKNVTFWLKHRLRIITTLNGNAVSTTVKIVDPAGRTFAALTDERGHAELILLYRMIGATENYTIGEYMVSSAYYGYSANERVILDRSRTVEIRWIDQSPPVISGLEFERVLWNVENRVVPSIAVRAKIVDKESRVVRNISIFYTTNGGVTWNQISMENAGGDMYEGVIPGQGIGVTIGFYVMATDLAGNNASAPIITYNEAPELVIISYALLFLLLGLICAVVGNTIIKRRTLARYKFFAKQKFYHRRRER